MIVTERRARNRMWCPFARVIHSESDESSPHPDRVGILREDSHVVNRQYDDMLESALCYASDCMMWVTAKEVPSDDGDDLSGNNEGYCGLVGIHAIKGGH